MEPDQHNVPRPGAAEPYRVQRAFKRFRVDKRWSSRWARIRDNVQSIHAGVLIAEPNQRKSIRIPLVVVDKIQYSYQGALSFSTFRLLIFTAFIRPESSRSPYLCIYNILQARVTAMRSDLL